MTLLTLIGSAAVTIITLVLIIGAGISWQENDFSIFQVSVIFSLIASLAYAVATTFFWFLGKGFLS